MAEEFEDQDLSDSVFWGVKLENAYVRDADLSGARFFHTWWKGAVIDGIIDGLVINGVDVTEYVNAHDRWYPLRTQLEPTTNAELCSTWATLQQEWAHVFDQVATLPADVPTRSVNGEWSLLDTCRHLVFVMDKWFRVPILGQRTFSPMGLPNSGSQNLDWPGIDMATTPSLSQALSQCASYADTFGEFIATHSLDEIPSEVEVLENGVVPVLTCFHAVLEEEFEHLRYVRRDLGLS